MSCLRLHLGVTENLTENLSHVVSRCAVNLHASTCAALALPQFAVSTSGSSDRSIDDRTCTRTSGLRTGGLCFLLLGKSLQQGIIGDDKDFCREGLRKVQGH